MSSDQVELLQFESLKIPIWGWGVAKNPIFLWTDIFNLMAQSLRILFCALCSLFFVAAFSSLAVKLGSR